MFDLDAPAENIGVLTKWLAGQHRPEHLYRGQTKDYPVMVPSIFRPLVADLSDASPIAKIDAGRLGNFAPQAAARLEMLNRVIGIAGIGLGNIIAQQYGLSSESLDVTESIDIASFFATRRYPSYTHVEDGIGVIYRFDSSAGRRLRFPFTLSNLDDLFERGKSDAGFFDFFVKKTEMDRIFDRDRWFGFQEGEEKVVSAISFATSWQDLEEAIDARQADLARPGQAATSQLARTIDALDWGRTRFAAQRGGFIRPAIFWNSLVPKDYSLINTRQEMARAYGGVSLRFDGGSDEQGPINALPLIIPSSAIKQTIVGVENLRSRADCQAFFFQHGPRRAAPVFRRGLWPEPSEDPLYGELWNLAIRMLIRRHFPNDIPPVDDPDHGLLDRGYRVAGEKATRDAREIEDIYRGQLEDAEEAIAAHGPTSTRYAAKGWALFQLGRRREALRALAEGLRADRTDIDLLIGLAELLRAANKPRWAGKVIEHGGRIDPDSLRVIEALADAQTDALDFAGAAGTVDRGLALADESLDWRERARFVVLRIALAELLGEQALSTQLRDVARKADIDIEEAHELALKLRALKARSDNAGAGPQQ
ncbi:hypothetical protein [Bosea sp. NBC_00550]|uniref:hypothetical protein n=1 Tax=Bosea sp. NBC_00550 TaxID=2969621 RepID=UPI00222FC128|nr:hypothetical protein [Bosea sp. NBC_00550]UZF94292.1 hypothetical protein NWE53_08940 [Bosea sp. NBC_00550]